MRVSWINIPEEIEAGAAAAILRPQGEVLGLRRSQNQHSRKQNKWVKRKQALADLSPLC